MRVFVTGATGFVGSAVVKELLDAGHTVLGLARSAESARKLKTVGAEVHLGSLEDVESLKQGAMACDGVIHCAFVHDFSNYMQSCLIDMTAIQTIGSVLSGSGRPFVVTFGTGAKPQGRSGTEDDDPDLSSPVAARSKGDKPTLALKEQGVRVSIIRLPPSVHGEGDGGFVPTLIALARQKGTATYVGSGLNRWPSVHVLDAARLYRLALEKGEAGARYHAVGDEGIPFKSLAEIIARGAKVPVRSVTQEEAPAYLGFLSVFAAFDLPTSSQKTQQRLGWHPTQPGLLDDLAPEGHYFDPSRSSSKYVKA